MQQLWGAGPPWLWLISKDFGDVKIIRPFHGVKMTELSIILLWLWGWISTIMKVLFHKKSSCLSSRSFRNLYKNLCTLLQNYFWRMNNGANRRLKGQTDLKGAQKLYFVSPFVHVLELAGLWGVDDNETFGYKWNDFHSVHFGSHCWWEHFEMYPSQWPLPFKCQC